MAGNMEAYLNRVRQVIAEHGWLVQGVLAGEGSPQMHYTVGLWPSVGFEVIVVGLPGGVGQIILNDVARRVLDGLRFVNGQVFDDIIAGYDAMMIEIPVSGGYMGTANRMYRLNGVNIPAWQLVYPDRMKLWPWEEGSNVASMPLLGTPPGIRP